MLWALLVGIALGGEVVVEAKVPTEVWMAGQKIAENSYPCQVRFEAPDGEVDLLLVVNGANNTVKVTVPTTGAALVHVGRTGITTGHTDAPTLAAGQTATRVQFRSAAREDLVLYVDGGKHELSPAAVLSIDLDLGDHKVSLRSRDGTIVYATGLLRVEGDGLVVQLADGRMPEIAGDGGSFSPGNR